MLILRIDSAIYGCKFARKSATASGLSGFPLKEIIDFGDSLSVSGFIVLVHAWTKSKCLPGVKQIDTFREAADDVSRELVGRA